jgi:hypothetical protein
MKLQIYTAIKERLQEIAGIGLVVLDNGQFEDSEASQTRQHHIKFPACLLSFPQMEYSTLALGIQQCEFTLQVRCGVMSLKDEDTSVLTFAQSVHAKLQNYSNEHHNTLGRISEQQDTNHANLISFTINYNGSFVDESGRIDANFIEHQITEIEIQKDEWKPYPPNNES